MYFIRLRKFPCVASLLSASNMKGSWILSNVLCESIEIIMRSLPSVPLIRCVTLIDFYISHSWDKSHLVVAYNVILYVSGFGLLVSYWHLFIFIHKRHLYIIFLECLWFWYRGNASYMDWSGKFSFLFCHDTILRVVCYTSKKLTSKGRVCRHVN